MFRPYITRAARIRGFHSSAPRNFEFIDVLSPIHDTFLYAHNSGLQWHTLLPLSAFAFRSVITLPLSISNRLRARKQHELQPILSASVPIMRAKLAATQAAKNGTLTPEQIHVLANKERRNRRVKLFKEHKCQVWKSVVFLPAVQVPLWIVMSLVVRAMCGWSVLEGIPLEPSLKDDSFLWCKDLTTADPYGALPLSIGTMALVNMEWNAMQLTNNSPTPGAKPPLVSRVLTNMSRFGVLIFMTITFQAPSALCLYWLASNGFSLMQNFLLDTFLPLKYRPTFGYSNISPSTMAIEPAESGSANKTQN